MNTFKLLKKLSETAGPSGFEQPIALVIEETWKPHVDSCAIDRVGNLIAIKQGQGKAPRPSLLLAAHMDEIGLMVSHLEEHHGQGFLRVTPLGGVDNRHLFGQLVTVHGRQALTGVIGCLPASMLALERRSKPFNFEDLLVDVGLAAGEMAQMVSIGDFVTFRQPLRKLLGKRVAGKALDNRSSVAAVSVALALLGDRTHSWDVVSVATSQEETRLLGAFTSAHAQRPDAAVAIDVDFGKGPGAGDDETFELGDGLVLHLGPNVHPGMHAALKQAAASLEMQVHTGFHAQASGTDAFALQVARQGVPTAIIGIPLRYMHTMVESMDIVDIERCGRLLAEFICQLDDQFLGQLSASMMEKGG